MRILVIGATGTIGKEVVAALQGAHDVVPASRNTGIEVDIRDVESVRAMYKQAGRVQAVICASGSGAWKPLEELTDDDFAITLAYKLMGQVNVIRQGLGAVADGGSITVTSGVLSQKPMKNSAAISMVNSGLEGFVRAAALEAPRGIRVNVVSPPWVTETLEALGRPPEGGLPAETVAKAYVRSVEGQDTGKVLTP